MAGWDIADRVVGLFAIIVGVAAGALVCVVLIGSAGGMASDWAAWVQAVGSIGAILAAAGIASGQVRRNHTYRGLHSQSLLRGLSELMQNCAYAMGRNSYVFRNLEPGVSPAKAAAIRASSLKALLDALERVPFHELPYVYVVGPASNTLSAGRTAVFRLEAIQKATTEPERRVLINELWDLGDLVFGWANQTETFAKRYDGFTSPNVSDEELSHIVDASHRVYIKGHQGDHYYGRPNGWNRFRA